MIIQTYTKRPVQIVAVQWDDRTAPEDIAEWCGGRVVYHDRDTPEQRPELIRISTLEGTMDAKPTDWIIKGIKGEFYPCRADIFDATYVESDDVPETDWER